MADATPTTIAKGVLSILEAASLSQGITPERSYADWELNLEDNDCLYVDVVAVATEQKTDLSARGSLRLMVPVDIAVRKKFGTENRDDDTGRVELSLIDGLVQLVQEIFELFTADRMSDFADAIWQSTQVIVCPDKTSLRQNHQFLGLVRVTFRVDKDLA